MDVYSPDEIVKKHLDDWNEVTGFVKKETGYYWELLSVMEDAAKEYIEQRSEPVSLKRIVTGTELAKDFHKWYEELAPEFGYETRKETKELDFDSPNGKLMLAVCERIIEKYQ